MPVDEAKIIELLYVRGPFTASHLAAELGNGVKSIDVDVDACLMDLLRRGLIRDSRTRPQRWELTEAGKAAGWRQKARASG